MLDGEEKMSEFCQAIDKELVRKGLGAGVTKVDESYRMDYESDNFCAKSFINCRK